MKKINNKANFLLKGVVSILTSFLLLFIFSVKVNAEMPVEGNIENVVQYIKEDGTIDFDDEGEPIMPKENKIYYGPQLFAAGPAKNYFPWNNWQTDPDIGFKWWSEAATSGSILYKQRKAVHNEFTLKSKGDTVASLEDYGRLASAVKNKFYRFSTDTKIKVYDQKYWRNIPGRPSGKDYQWSSKMQPNLRIDAYVNNEETFGGYFNTPTKDAKKISPRNDWQTDEEKSVIEADIEVEPIIFEFKSTDITAHNQMDFYFTMNPYTGEQWGGARRVLVPKVVHVEYRGMRTGKSIAGLAHIYGKEKTIYDPLNISAKDYPGYRYDHYEYVPENGESIKSAKGEKTWTGKMSTSKRGILFWYEEPWNVEFEPNGGAPKPDDQAVFNNEKAAEPNAPKRDGYIFEGWYEDKELTKKYSFATLVTKDIKLYAKWTEPAKNWTVEFEPEGGAPKPATQTVKDGELAKEPTGSQVPKKGDSIFGGWYTDKSLTTKYNFSTPVKSNIKLYAKWTEPVKNWTVEFEPEGGAPKPATQTVKDGELAKKPTGNEVPKKENFVFDGWYLNKTDSNPYNFDTPVKKNIVLYAKWKETKKWTVTFHPGNDVIKRTTPDPNPQYVEDGGVATKPVSKYSSTLIGKEYHPTSSADPYREFDPDDPSQGPEGVRMPNQKFISWYEDKALTQEYDFKTPVKKDIDLYAKWELNPALGAQLKSFDRDTLETKYDDGPYKAPGNKITDVRVGEKFSYQLMMRNIFTDRPEAKLGKLTSELPDEIETPTKVEFFTIDGKGNGAIQEPVYETLKVHEIPEKSKVSALDKDEYYEVVTDTDGARKLSFHNMKTNEIKGRNFIGVMFDTKLVKQPKINAAKEYVFYGKTDQQVLNLFTYNFLSNGNLPPIGFMYFANNAVHVPWKVEFEPNGGTPKPKDQFVRNEKLAKEPTGKEVPTKADKVFGGWYKDKNLTDKYNFSTPVTSDMILYAKWSELPPELDLYKTSDKRLYEAKEVVHYTLTMKNNTNGTLNDARLGDMVPEGLSKPENVKLDNVLLKEGASNANGEGAYYTWNPVERTLTLHYKELSGKGERKLTYDSTVISGKANEIKTNKAIFTGSNSKGTAGSEHSIKIVGPKANLHVKQEVVGKHNEIVVPKTGYLQLDLVNTVNTADKKNQVSLTMPSYEADTDKPFKDVMLRLHYGYTGYLPKEIIPEFYNYDGYQLTTDNGNHKSANKTASNMPVLDLKDNQEYWLTIYVKPKTGEDGPPFYNWDSKTNDFGLVKSFFDWENWQKDAKLLFKYGRDGDHPGIYTKYYLEYEGDTVIRLEDYGRERGAKHTLPAGDPKGMEDPTRNPYETWEPEMGVVVRNPNSWKNIPSKATIDPATNEASWNGKMATQYLKNDTYYYIGGYFLDTTPDPPEFPLQNYWSKDDIESNFSPLSSKADPIIFDFVDKNIPAEVFVTMKYTTNQSINYIYEAGNRNTFTPQMIKAQFRDIDSNQQISPEQVKGKGGRYKDSISFNAENVSGYTFDHYEYVDSRENKEVGSKGDSTWNGQMTTAKKGIVFWYKK
ncbi:InlB B-repeat-containing protein [Vagococcus carniphilus]|uniref:InlB B-repeat-containing protein n=1 Tax=Vagococcus carniphilus TaxID=218144 RepID=UPI003BAB1130